MGGIQPDLYAWTLILFITTYAGSARVKSCLELHRHEDAFSAECRDELESMMKERADDFRLDSQLRGACEEDIMYTCGWEDVSDQIVDAFQGRVLLH